MKKESKELGGGEGGRGILSILAFSHDNLHCPEETLTFSNASKYFFLLFFKQATVEWTQPQNFFNSFNISRLEVAKQLLTI